jgi:hypothetical protein
LRIPAGKGGVEVFGRSNTRLSQIVELLRVRLLLLLDGELTSSDLLLLLLLLSGRTFLPRIATLSAL